MKTCLSASQVFCNVIFAFFLFGFTQLTSAQCPTINNPNPVICADGAGYTFSDLNAYATDAGNGLVWYDAATGGNSFNQNELVFEGTYYLGDNSGTCGTRPSLFVDFTVSPSTPLPPQRVYCRENGDEPTFQEYIDEIIQPFIPPGGSVEMYYDLNLTNLIDPTDDILRGGRSYYVVLVDAGACRSQIETVEIFVVPGVEANPPSPQLFCSGSNPVVSDLNTDTNPPDTFSWYESLDSNGNTIPPAMDPTDPLINGRTYYLEVQGTFCSSDPIPVSVVINSEASGVSNVLDFCETKIPALDFNLFDVLGNPKDNTGAWTGPAPTTNGHLGTVNISTFVVGTYTFTYRVPTNGSCPDLTSTVTIEIDESLSSGTVLNPSPPVFCTANLPSSFDLFSELTGYDPGGQWTSGTQSSDPVVTSPIDLSAFTIGTYFFTYTQNLSPNVCAEESTTIQIDIVDVPQAGNAINQNICENRTSDNSPFDLFSALDGTQSNNNGVWRDASNNIISNVIDITAFTFANSPYTFSYSVGTGSCSDTEIVTLNIDESPESGTANAPAEFCESIAPSTFDLFSLLTGADLGGNWYIGSDNLGATTTNIIDLSSFTAATYSFTYEVTPIGACIDDLVTVQIIIRESPNPGIAETAIFCENDLAANSPLDLFAQLIGEDSGGIWSDDDTTGALSGSNVDLTRLGVGLYNYTYAVTSLNGCIDSATVMVEIRLAPDSGVPNAPQEFCEADITTGQTYDLFNSLTGANPSGTWNDDDNTGGLSGSIVSLDGLTEGTYNFTYSVDPIGTCDDDDVTVSLIINNVSEPSADANQLFCDSARISDLTATGNAIVWYDVPSGGDPLDAATVLSNAQTYYAAQTDLVSGCQSFVRTPVLVTINISPNPGLPSAIPIIACNNDNAIDLFNGLDGSQDSGGVWQNDDGEGTLTGSIFDATGLIPGSYNFTYEVTGIAPCVDNSTTISVVIEEPLNAGTDNTLDVCSDSGATDLFTLLGTADAGGTWSPELASGNGIFDPLLDNDGTYTYTVSNSCGTDSSEVVISVTLAPDAGADNSINLCMVDSATDLFVLLGTTAQMGGEWTPALTSGTGVFDPAVDAQGVYTYTVQSELPCALTDSAEIVVTVSDSPPIVVLEPAPEYCTADNPTVFNLINSIRPTGSVKWYEDAALTVPLSDSDPLINGEDYYATQTNQSGCESSIAVKIDVTLNDAPTPTIKDTSVAYCITDGPTIHDLSLNISEFNASSNNIVWYDSPTGGTAYDTSTEIRDLTYYAALIDATSGCESSIRLEVTPDVTACPKVAMPDGFSPNGDGVNDTLDLDFLGLLYPDFIMEIYNRYGNMVYKGGANTPRFDGTANQSNVLLKGDLPVGVYFYIFNFNDGENQPEQGRIYLSR
ncbi:gliding motility-associated C-terminal domain-containing protein [Cognatitamlana onchidii]|uniref:gliding motility-associated C-terminal domain-containing protein n=1 Tax=Cognatitamlana onchidii TaxID=2562860 RepID=UPI0010A5DE31|nr:gliding motility-associated C-terminal domain-containing protein [Algibacter onchidii]